MADPRGADEHSAAVEQTAATRNVVLALISRLEHELADAQHRARDIGDIDARGKCRHFERAIELTVLEARTLGLDVWSSAL